MSTVLGLDYSGGRPAGHAVATAGYGFVARYLPNGLASGRVNLSAAEVSDMHGAGVAVVMVWETQANRASAGRAAGVADATIAAAQAKVVGQSDLPIYFAVDFDLPDYSPAATSPVAKLGPVGEYFAGVVSVLGLPRTGVYGGYWAVRRCLDAGLATWAWQTVAWSGGLIDPRIHLYQRAGYVTVDGVQCDVNEARRPDYGQGPASTPTPTPTEDDDMAGTLVYRNPSAWLLVAYESGRLVDAGVQDATSTTFNGCVILAADADKEAELRAKDARWNKIQDALASPAQISLGDVTATLNVPKFWKATDAGAGVTTIEAQEG